MSYDKKPPQADSEEANRPHDKQMPSSLYVWIVPSASVQEQPGSWRIRKWDTEPFREATHVCAPGAHIQELQSARYVLWRQHEEADRERIQLRHDIERATANHAADLNGGVVSANQRSAEAAIREHNDEMEQMCKARYTGNACSYRDAEGRMIYPPRTCPDCPKDYKIDYAAAQEPSKQQVGASAQGETVPASASPATQPLERPQGHDAARDRIAACVKEIQIIADEFGYDPTEWLADEEAAPSSIAPSKPEAWMLVTKQGARSPWASVQFVPVDDIRLKADEIQRDAAPHQWKGLYALD